MEGLIGFVSSPQYHLIGSFTCRHSKNEHFFAPTRNLNLKSRKTLHSLKSRRSTLRSVYSISNENEGESFSYRPLEGKRKKLREVNEKIELLKRVGPVGEHWRRNAWWAGIPLQIMRNHSSCRAASSASFITTQKVADLTLLRRDCAPFAAAVCSCPLKAAQLPTLFGMSNATSTRGGDRRTVVKAWIDITRHCRSYQPTVKPSFEDRFELQHCANAAFTYIYALDDKWHREVGDVAPQSCSAVRLREAGACVRRFGGTACVATPIAFIIHRCSEDFWMWGKEDCLLLAHSYPPYDLRGSRLAVLRLRPPPSMLPLYHCMQAQFALACSDSWVRTADVVLYSPFGGANIFRVHRDDRFLEIAERYVSSFMANYVARGVPPPVSFWKDLRGSAVIKLARNCRADVETLAVLPADECETSLDLARAEMSDWEKERAEEEFLVPKRK